jgi:hypothetical protein
LNNGLSFFQNGLFHAWVAREALFDEFVSKQDRKVINLVSKFSLYPVGMWASI